ncbi:MAG: hypothetical protein U0931_26585 [Vulcanimicrobiota bacterium]
MLALVVAADMLGSPPLTDSPSPVPGQAAPGWSEPSSLEQATDIYIGSGQPQDWGRRRAASAYLLARLNPPQQHRNEWERLGQRLKSAPPAATAWDCLILASHNPVRARGWLGPYQNRLNGLRQQQITEASLSLKEILNSNDYVGFVQKLPSQGESSGVLGLTLFLQPVARIGREDLLPYGLWWGVLANQSNEQALQAGLRLSLGKAPQLPYRQEGRECVCWTAGPDGQDEGGLVEASLSEPADEPVTGDWIYRFRL